MFRRREKKGYWDKAETESEVYDEPKVVSVEKYRIIGHTIEYCGDDEYSSYVAYNNDGELDHIELDGDTKIPQEVENIVGSYVEITTYDDDEYSTRLSSY